MCLALAIASAWVFVMFSENLVELFWSDEGIILEEFFKSFVGLVEPELIKIENASLGGIEPDGVTLGFAEFAAGHFVDNEWAGISVSLGALEALDEVNAASAVAVLVGAAKLKVDIVFAEEV